MDSVKAATLCNFQYFLRPQRELFLNPLRALRPLRERDVFPGKILLIKLVALHLQPAIRMPGWRNW